MSRRGQRNPTCRTSPDDHVLHLGRELHAGDTGYGRNQEADNVLCADQSCLTVQGAVFRGETSTSAHGHDCGGSMRGVPVGDEMRNCRVVLVRNCAPSMATGPCEHD